MYCQLCQEDFGKWFDRQGVERFVIWNKDYLIGVVVSGWDIRMLRAICGTICVDISPLKCDSAVLFHNYILKTGTVPGPAWLAKKPERPSWPTSYLAVTTGTPSKRLIWMICLKGNTSQIELTASLETFWTNVCWPTFSHCELQVWLSSTAYFSSILTTSNTRHWRFNQLHSSKSLQ